MGIKIKNIITFLVIQMMLVLQNLILTSFIAINKSNIKEDEEIFIQPCDASIDLDWDLFTKENKKRS